MCAVARSDVVLLDYKGADVVGASAIVAATVKTNTGLRRKIFNA